VHLDSALLLLLAAATVVALVARRLRIPYTVGLVLGGIVLGAVHPSAGIRLTKDLLYSVVLPGLIFEAAYHLDFMEFRRSARGIFALAVPGVVLAIGATTSLLVLCAHATGAVTGFDRPQALVFSALIAATDPIAVVALFKGLGAPTRLGVLTEAESLVNDGTGIVFFTIVFASVTRGAGLGVGAAVVEFLRVAGLGFVVGAGLAFPLSHVIRRVDDAMLEITLTIIAAYGAFLFAERLHASGVIATLTTGMICGNRASPRSMTEATRIALESFWEYVAFALNSVVFLLIGLEVQVREMLGAWAPIAEAFVAVTVARAAIVFVVWLLLRKTAERVPWRWGVMLTWGGLRGALSIVLALGLPAGFPQRQLIVTTTFGVVLLSIVVQGTTAGPLLKVLGLAGEPRERHAGSSDVG
jgi:CPA1 family monovalent cation:H+ antiporter